MYDSKFVDIDDAKVLPDVKFQEGKTPADIMNRLNALKNRQFASSLINENRNTTYGAMVGLATGFLTALWFKKSKIMYSLIGTVSGAFVGYSVNTVQNYKQLRLMKKQNTNGKVI